MTKIVQFAISNRKALRRKFWSSSFLLVGGCVPVGRQKLQVQTFELFLHSLLFSAVEVIPNIFLPGGLLLGCSEDFYLVFMSKAFFGNNSTARFQSPCAVAISLQ